MSQNNLIDLLVANGTIRTDATGALADVKAQPAQPAQPVLQNLPGGLDFWAKGLDQPADPEPSEVDRLRAARLQQAAAGAIASLTAQERFEAARTRARRAGLYQ